MAPPPSSIAELRAKYGFLVWSNPQGASDETFVVAALRRGNFVELLDFAGVLGLDRLRSAWTTLQEAEPEAARQAGMAVERILRNLQTAADLCAQTRHPEAMGPITR
jgi:hypothetical protein